MSQEQVQVFFKRDFQDQKLNFITTRIHLRLTRLICTPGETKVLWLRKHLSLRHLQLAAFELNEHIKLQGSDALPVLKCMQVPLE